jgi:hypothetical protein
MTTRTIRRFVFGSSLALALVAGCASSGLSIRERPGMDYSSYALALYDVEPSAPALPARRMALPARVAVAQLGEVAPPQAMLDAMRKDTAFASVHTVPGGIDVAPEFPHDRGSTASDRVALQQSLARQRADRLRRHARDGGADYLFLFGGTVDHAATGTPLGVADLTIVGMFLVPSKRLSADARAGGTLVDAHTGRVVASVSAQSAGQRIAPTAAQDNSQLKLMTRLRDEVSTELGKQLAERMRQIATQRAAGGEQQAISSAIP